MRTALDWLLVSVALTRGTCQKAGVGSARKCVYIFGDGQSEGGAQDKELLGGKGAGLAEMTRLGLPVPPGFTISAKLCLTYLETNTFPDELPEEIDRHV